MCFMKVCFDIGCFNIIYERIFYLGGIRITIFFIDVRFWLFLMLVDNYGRNGGNIKFICNIREFGLLN